MTAVAPRRRCTRTGYVASRGEECRPDGESCWCRMWYFWLLAAIAGWTALSFVVGLLLGPVLGSDSRGARRRLRGTSVGRRAARSPDRSLGAGR
jgi:hypothetical protein